MTIIDYWRQGFFNISPGFQSLPASRRRSAHPGRPCGVVDGVGAAGEGVIPVVFRKEHQIVTEHHGKHAAFKGAAVAQPQQLKAALLLLSVHSVTGYRDCPE